MAKEKDRYKFVHQLHNYDVEMMRWLLCNGQQIALRHNLLNGDQRFQYFEIEWASPTITAYRTRVKVSGKKGGGVIEHVEKSNIRKRQDIINIWSIRETDPVSAQEEKARNLVDSVVDRIVELIYNHDYWYSYDEEYRLPESYYENW